MARYLCSIFLIILLSAQAVSAQNDWSSIATLQGEEIRILTKDEKVINARLVSINDTQLEVKKRRKLVIYNRKDIRRVYKLLDRKATVKAAAIGAGVGFAAGAATIARIGNDDGGPASGEAIVIVGLIGAGIGTGLGLLFSGAGKKQVLVYEAP